MQIMFNGPFGGHDSGSFLVKLKYAANERIVMEEVRDMFKKNNKNKTPNRVLKSQMIYRVRLFSIADD